MKTILIYLIVINVVTFVIYGYDKWQSQHGGWRISERALLGLVAAFGATDAFGAAAAGFATTGAGMSIGMSSLETWDEKCST